MKVNGRHIEKKKHPPSSLFSRQSTLINRRAPPVTTTTSSSCRGLASNPAYPDGTDRFFPMPETHKNSLYCSLPL